MQGNVNQGATFDQTVSNATPRYDDTGKSVQQKYPPQQGYPPHMVISPQQQVVVVNYAAPPPAPTTIVRSIQVQPENYLLLSVLVLIFCCPIFGIIALLHSLQVQKRFNRGEFNGAERSSKSARQSINLSVSFGIIQWCVYICCVIIWI